jgi:pimeloyl-ACP methyl ester carboxylesterase
MYGRSLGGIVATHLAANYPENISLLIADRTFGSLKDVSLRKFEGKGTAALFDIITLQWETHNDQNFFNVMISFFNYSI